MGIRAMKRLSIGVLALLFALVAPLGHDGSLGVAQAAAAEEEPKKKQKTRRVPSLSESVYKKLGEGQEAIDAKDYALALEVIQGALNRSRRYNELSLIHI